MRLLCQPWPAWHAFPARGGAHNPFTMTFMRDSESFIGASKGIVCDSSHQFFHCKNF
jgi:hypothetical protein